MSGTRGGRLRLLVALLVLLGLVGLFVGASYYADLLWFLELGYEGVFLGILAYRFGLFIVAALVTALVLYASYRVVRSNLAELGSAPHRAGTLGVIGALSLFVGLLYAGGWETVLRFLHATPFGVTDPIFGRDVAFFVYTLPLLNLAVGFLLLVLALGLLFSLTLYLLPFVIEAPDEEVGFTLDTATAYSYLRGRVYGHLVVYVGAIMVVLGGSFALDRYGLLYSSRGAVFGMGATDQTIFLPLFGLLAVTAALGGILVALSGRIGDVRAAYVPIAILVGFFIVGNVAGVVYQGFVVGPDEFNKEEQFIENEIEFTNHAYALDRIDEQEFPVSDSLSREQVEDNPGTIDNARLWDPRPLLTTYNELQIFRTYYQFTDVDIDRYEIDGQMREVMVSARELEFDALQEESKSWVNRHLVYTHGYGLAMSPVNAVTEDGLPELYVKDIPPNSSVGIEVDQPRIYYGEATTDYAIVNSGTRELDYPSGGENVYTDYDAEGGVPLDSTIKKLVYSLQFGDPQIFLSDSVTDDSRLQFDRDIQSRAPKIAPFLEYDDDPYVVTSNGKLYWIYDAYTTSDNYPYSDRAQFKGERANYVRNSVKVVVDAYTGETTYYVAETEDPLVQTYRKAFPELFEDFEDMPAHLQEHIRYPEDAFRVQAQQYLTYHMKEPQVFYNKEDAWRIPNEVTRGEEISMEPYYIIMTFPGQEEPEFVMVQPYIPEGRQNMIGWLAARSDPAEYGTLKSFLFSKQRLIFGPMQIESRIDQDADISQQITLWSESGSRVIRGNLLAIPIEDTIIYIEPLFLESREEGALPELKRVILAHGNRVTMQPSLEQALAVMLGAAEPEAPGPGTGAGLTEDQLERAQTLYEEAQTALQEGEFATYAQRIEDLGALLESAEVGGGNETG
ncbi:MAG: UPF0182 family protein [Haloarculaceae archaeon]